MNTGLWIVQAFLALAFVASGVLKIFFYDRFQAFVDEKGPGGMNRGFAAFIGISELAEAWV
jgi:uncharacterized membrane protein YphA (DoxX/SURF4 family)